MSSLTNEVFGTNNDKNNNSSNEIISLINKQTNLINSQSNVFNNKSKQIISNTDTIGDQTTEIIGNTNTIMGQASGISQQATGISNQASGISNQATGISSQANAILTLLNTMNNTLIDLSNNSIGSSSINGISDSIPGIDEPFTTRESFFQSQYLATSREGLTPAPVSSTVSSIPYGPITQPMYGPITPPSPSPSPSPSSDPMSSPMPSPSSMSSPSPSSMSSPSPSSMSSPSPSSMSSPSPSSMSSPSPSSMSSPSLTSSSGTSSSSGLTQTDGNLLNYASLYYSPQQFPNTDPNTLTQYYTDALVSGTSPAYINSPTTPGNRYFLNTKTPCKDSGGKLQDRAVLIDNVLQSKVNNSNTQGYNGLLYSLFSSLDNIASSSIFHVQDICGTTPLSLSSPSSSSYSPSSSGIIMGSNLPTCAPVTVYIDGTNTGVTSAYLTQSDIQEVDPLAIQSEGFTCTNNENKNKKNKEMDMVTQFYIGSLIAISVFILYSLYQKVRK